ncbi:hypothetical protein ACH5RR_003156 [Cinchona calisaya]|uniref:Cytochrome c oxidase subunit 3 n=1 Tax=Cinchona calisaya TaxID=153742 RepID=A0ABD3AU52_9GENT
MPQLDKFTYLTQFFWSCLFLLTFYIAICNDRDGVLGISRILKLRNQLLSHRANKIRSKDPKSLEEILRKGFSTGVSYMYSSLFEVSQWCKAVDLLGKRRKMTLISCFGEISGSRGMERNIFYLISKSSYSTSSNPGWGITCRNDIMLIHNEGTTPTTPMSFLVGKNQPNPKSVSLQFERGAEQSKKKARQMKLKRELLSVLEYSFFFFALHKYKWSVPSRGEKPVARLVSEYAQEMDIQNVPLLTPEQYLDEIATHLEFKCFNHGIETLPGGHSWTELAQSVISSRNADLTDLSTLTYGVWVKGDLHTTEAKWFMIESQRHSYHLVDPSPWPISGSLGALATTVGGVMYMHSFQGGATLLSLGLIFILYTMFVWWRDVLRESTLEGHHTKVVQLGPRYGFILFIVSEVMFFFAFFRASSHSSLAPTVEIGGICPPKGIEVLDPWEIPFLNTLIPPSSGAAVTWAHHAILAGKEK